MFSSKRLFVVAWLVSVVVLLGLSMARADVITPTAIPYHSQDGDDWSYPTGNVSHLYDGITDTGNFGILYDDTTFVSPSEPITGYAIFDLGAVKDTVTQAQVYDRAFADTTVHNMPRNVTFFYFDDDNAHAFADSTAIASDSHVVSVWTGDLPDLYGDDTPNTPAVVTFDSSILSKQYVGMRLNSSWNDSNSSTGPQTWGADASNACSQMAEVNFVTPEPSTLILLATGLIGLLCYAWRKRR